MRCLLILQLIGCLLLPAAAADQPLFGDEHLALGSAEIRQALNGLSEAQLAQLREQPGQLSQFLLEFYVATRMAEEARTRGLADPERLTALLARTERQYLVDRLMTDQARRRELPDFEALARDYYRANRDEFVQPARVRVAHILIETGPCDCEAPETPRELAERLLAELRAGADFGELALEHSADPGSAALDGRIQGWVEPGRMVPEFETAALALEEPGELSDVVETDFGYHIIRLLEREPERLREFDEVRGQIIRRLSNEYSSRKARQFREQFLPAPDVQADLDAIYRLLGEFDRRE